MENNSIPTIESPEGIENAVNEGYASTTVATVEPTMDKRCPVCMALVTDKQVFCSECGAPLKKSCPGCKTELKDNQNFCPVCGMKNDAGMANADVARFNAEVTPPKGKMKVWPFIVGVAVAITIIIIALVVSNVMKQKKIEEYIQNAEEFYDVVLSSGADMETAGNSIQAAWKKYVYNSLYGTYYNGTYVYSIESAVAAAQKERESEISSVKSNDSKVKSLYEKLKEIPDTKDTQLQEIKEAVQLVYDAYEQMYDVVIEVDGNYYTYISDFSATDSALAEALEELENLVK